MSKTVHFNKAEVILALTVFKHLNPDRHRDDAVRALIHKAQALEPGDTIMVTED